jgi:hypothetical protein
MVNRPCNCLPDIAQQLIVNFYQIDVVQACQLVRVGLGLGYQFFLSD